MRGTGNFIAMCLYSLAGLLSEEFSFKGPPLLLLCLIHSLLSSTLAPKKKKKDLFLFLSQDKIKFELQPIGCTNLC